MSKEKFIPISWMSEDDPPPVSKTERLSTPSASIQLELVKGVFFALLSGVSFAFVTLLFVFLGKSGIPNFQIIFIADLGMTLVLIPPIIYYRVSLICDSTKDITIMSCIGIGWTLGYIALLNALSRIPMGNMIAIIHGAMPILTALLSCMFLNESWREVDLIGTVINLTGIVLICKPTFIFGQVEDDDDIQPLGYVYALLCATAFSSICVMCRFVARNVCLLTVSFYKVTIGAVSALILALIFEPPVWHTETRVIFYFLGMIISNTLGTWSRFRSLQLEPAATVVLLANIQLVIAYLLDFIVFKKKPTAVDLIGASLIILSSALVSVYTWYKNVEKKKKQEEDVGNDFLYYAEIGAD